MRQFTAFAKKELLEQARSGRLLILTILFCLFGIMNPAIAKLTPWLMELLSDQLAESGMTVQNVTVTALQSWIQYFKNLPMAMIVFLVMYSGSFTAEYQKGTLINVVTKGMKRWKILTAKALTTGALWLAGNLLCFGITWAYNAYFWDNSVVQNIPLAAGGLCLMGLWLISVIPLASAFFSSGSAVTLSVGCAFLISYLLGFLPKLERFVPTCLMDSGALLLGAKAPRDYFAALAVTAALILLNLPLGIAAFNKRNL